ncbi:hypothetical protein MPSEU_000301900 [Mayamaea pseudoterrestris]|nr:hypothetical protein MPSEU_000301900 [Mayamaea pseudoterrestris]
MAFADGYVIRIADCSRTGWILRTPRCNRKCSVQLQFARRSQVSEPFENNEGNDLEFDVDPYLVGEKVYGLLDDEDDTVSGDESFFTIAERRQDDEVDQADKKLEAAIDSFLSGGFDKIAADAAAPHPDSTPAQVIDQSLRALRDLHRPTPSHGAAVFQRFLIPLNRGQRWGDSLRSSQHVDAWKEIQRGALTASMLAKRIRASEFAALLDWKRLDVSDGAIDPNRDFVGNPSVAFVNAALYLKSGRGLAPVLIQFTLQRVGGMWLIDTARKCNMDLYTDNDTLER